MNHNTKSDFKSAGSGAVAFFTVVVPIGVLLAIVIALCVFSVSAP